MLPQPELNEPGLHELLLAPITSQEIPQLVADLLKDAATTLRGTDPVATPVDTRLLMDQMAATIKLLRLAPRQVVQQAQDQVEQIADQQTRKIAFNLYFQALLVAGTNPTVLQAAQLVTNNRNRLSTAQRLQYLTTLPKYVKYPTKALLKEIQNVVVQNLKNEPVLYNAAVLSLSNLIYQACLNRKIQRVQYPVEIYGRFCTPEVVKNNFLQPFFNELKRGLSESNNEQVVVYLAALGNIGHPEVLPAVQRIVRETDAPTTVKIYAIFALQRLVNDYDGAHEAVTPSFIKHDVLPFLEQVIKNRNRKGPVRMAAVTLLVKSEYTTQEQWELIARLSQSDDDEEFKIYTATTIVNIARMKKPVTSEHTRMQKYARQVVKKIDQARGKPMHSLSYYQAREIQDLDIEYFQRYAQFRSNSSFFPTHFYAKSQIHLGKRGLPIIPYEVSLSFVNLNQLRESHGDYSMVKAFLNFRFLNNFQDIVKIDQETLEDVARNVQDSVAQAFQQSTATAQKMIMLSEFTKEMPTGLGMPLTKKLRSPLLISAHAKLGEAQLQNNGQAAQAQVSVRNVIVARLHYWIAVKVPFLGQKFQSGVDSRATVELPFRALARIGSAGTVELAITPAYIQGGSQPQGQIRLVKVKRVPYTAQVPSCIHRALAPQSSDVQITPIRTSRNPQQEQQHLGQQETGFALQYTREQDKPQKNGYGKMTGYVSAELVLDLDKSRTNTIYIAAAAGEDNKHSNNDATTVAIALVGKKNVVPPVSQSQSQQGKMQQIREGQQNTFQYLAQVTVNPKSHRSQQLEGDALVRVAAGNAANDAAKHLDQSQSQFKVVRQAILEGSTPQQQTDLCVEAQHEYNGQYPQSYHNAQMAMEIQQQLRFGPRCQDGQMRNTLTTQAKWTTTSQTHQGTIKMNVSYSTACRCYLIATMNFYKYC